MVTAKRFLTSPIHTCFILLFLSALLAVSEARSTESGTPSPPPEMVLIPGGEFIMGSDAVRIGKLAREAGADPAWFADEIGTRKVSAKDFFIDIYEVSYEKFSQFDPRREFPKSMKRHPVTQVSWEKADSYCRWAGKRLPTEAEWEKAARGTEGRLYPWGDEYDTSRANSQESKLGGGEARVGGYKLETSGAASVQGTAPVTAYEHGRSVYGLYNMSGNVWEWVGGWYDKERGLRLLKGGSWAGPAISQRPAVRLPELPKVESNEYGFRCARDTVPLVSR